MFWLGLGGLGHEWLGKYWRMLDALGFDKHRRRYTSCRFVRIDSFTRYSYPQCWGEEEFRKEFLNRLSQAEVHRENRLLVQGTNSTESYCNKGLPLVIRRTLPSGGIGELIKLEGFQINKHKNYVWARIENKNESCCFLLPHKMTNSAWRDLLVDFLFASPSDLEECMEYFFTVEVAGKYSRKLDRD